MNILIDEELVGIVTEEWIESVLSIVDPKMLENLTLRIIEPSKYDIHQDKIDSGDWDDEDVRKEVGRRLQVGQCTGEKEAELYLRKTGWTYYRGRRDYARALFHEIYHANDLEKNEDWKPEHTWQDPVWNHPREVRARAFTDQMWRKLKNKRKIIMSNAEVRSKHPELFDIEINEVITIAPKLGPTENTGGEK